MLVVSLIWKKCFELTVLYWIRFQSCFYFIMCKQCQIELDSSSCKEALDTFLWVNWSFECCIFISKMTINLAFFWEKSLKPVLFYFGTLPSQPAPFENKKIKRYLKEKKSNKAHFFPLTTLLKAVKKFKNHLMPRNHF